MFVGPVVGLLILAIASVSVIFGFRNGLVTRNVAIGIRTKATLASDEAWDAAHRRAEPYLFVAILICVAFAAALVTVDLGSFPEFIGHLLANAGLIIALAVILIGCFAGVRAAKNLNEE